MPILDFEDSQAKRPAANKPLKLVLGMGVLVGTLALGSTFASNISLNGGGNVEFGQGVATTTACDGDGIEVMPFSTFTNAPGAVTHKLTSIRISGIDSREGACDGKTFRIKAYGDGDAPLDLFRYKILTNTDNDSDNVELENKVHNTIEINDIEGAFTWSSGGTDGDDVIDVDNEYLDQTAFTLNFVSEVTNPVTISRTPLASAEDVKRITVETIDTTCREGVGCEIGDVGPGGGIVFYDAGAGSEFYCGPIGEMLCRYLEAAPNTWSEDNSDPEITWSTGSNQELEVEGADGTSIGVGYKNSLDIASQNGNVALTSAAVLARGYDGGNKSDWYLPSLDEIGELYVGRTVVASFVFNNYWTSSEIGFDGAWNFNLRINQSGGNGKFDNRGVRPIRAF
jgi:hypothetical protein